MEIRCVSTGYFFHDSEPALMTDAAKWDPIVISGFWQMNISLIQTDRPAANILVFADNSLILQPCKDASCCFPAVNN